MATKKPIPAAEPKVPAAPATDFDFVEVAVQPGRTVSHSLLTYRAGEIIVMATDQAERLIERGDVALA